MIMLCNLYYFIHNFSKQFLQHSCDNEQRNIITMWADSKLTFFFLSGNTVSYFPLDNRAGLWHL